MNTRELIAKTGNCFKQSAPRKPKKGLSRGAHRLRRASPKRQKEMKEYLRLRKEYLLYHQWCQIASQSGFEIPTCGHLAKDIHHKSGRGKNLLKTETWMSVCRSCHDWIHSHPKQARALGLLQ